MYRVDYGSVQNRANRNICYKRPQFNWANLEGFHLVWYQNRPQLQTSQFPLTRRVSSQWPRFNQLRDGQKLPKNRLWQICINTNCENPNDWVDYWSGRKINKIICFFLQKLKLLARLLVRSWPDQPDRLLRPCILLPRREEVDNKPEDRRWQRMAVWNQSLSNEYSHDGNTGRLHREFCVTE